MQNITYKYNKLFGNTKAVPSPVPSPVTSPVTSPSGHPSYPCSIPAPNRST